MKVPSVIIASALSGCLWAGVALLLGGHALGPPVWGGVMVAPLIGMALRLASRRFGRLRPWLRALVAVANLYAAAALFALGVGVFHLLAEIHSGAGRHPVSGAGLTEIVLGTWWGLTFSGYVVVLWPLSYATHALMFSLWPDRDERAGGLR